MLTARRPVLAAASLAALLAGLLAAVTPARAAPAAHAVTPAGTIFYTQHTPAGGYLNFWGGGDLVKDYNAVTYNDDVEIQWIGNNQFQLADLVHPGSCIGDWGNTSGSAEAGGGDPCPSTGNAGWGTIFTQSSAGCPAGYFVYRDRHWAADVYIDNVNGDVVVLNSGGGACLTQSD
jgi:hypothetical protein